MADSQVPWGVNALNGTVSEPACIAAASGVATLIEKAAKGPLLVAAR
jgi:hypothetical protein